MYVGTVYYFTWLINTKIASPAPTVSTPVSKPTKTANKHTEKQVSPGNSKTAEFEERMDLMETRMIEMINEQSADNKKIADEWDGFQRKIISIDHQLTAINDSLTQITENITKTVSSPSSQTDVVKDAFKAVELKILPIEKGMTKMLEDTSNNHQEEKNRQKNREESWK